MLTVDDYYLTKSHWMIPLWITTRIKNGSDLLRLFEFYFPMHIMAAGLRETIPGNICFSPWRVEYDIVYVTCLWISEKSSYDTILIKCHQKL